MSHISLHSFYDCEQYRKTHGNQGLKPLLQEAVNRLIKHHLSQDRYFAYDFNPGKIELYTRKGNRIAYEQGNRIFLYDLIGRKVMWSCEVAIRERYFSSKLEIFNKNQVRVLSTSAFVTNPDIDIAIIAAGRIIASTTLSSDDSEMNKQNLNTHQMHLFYREAQTVRVIDQTDGSISLISLENFHWHHTKGYVNRDFYVVTSHLAAQIKQSDQVFVFDRVTEKKKVFDFERRNGLIALSCVYIHKNHLICGISDYLSVLNQFNSPAIHVMSLITGETVKKYSLESFKCSITNCIANDDWIVYVTAGGMNHLMCLHRQTAQQTLLLSYGYLYKDMMQLSLSKNLLHICHTTNTLQYFKVIDLTSMETISHVPFQHHRADEVVFTKGKLVIFNPSDLNRPTFYIEDFEKVDGDASQRASEEMIARRTRQ